MHKGGSILTVHLAAIARNKKKDTALPPENMIEARFNDMSTLFPFPSTRITLGDITLKQ